MDRRTCASTGTHNHLNPSELGTKEYWDSLYRRELQIHADDEEDEGTIWFNESNAEATVLRELDTLSGEGLLDRETATFLDLGTGNGHMLFALRYPNLDDEYDDPEQETGGNAEWRGEMVGVDYSAASIDLARRIAAQRHDRFATATSSSGIRFETWDLLTQKPSPSWLPTNTAAFDVVLDKGTFDAISLMPTSTTNPESEHPCSIYHRNVLPLTKEHGFLIVTSCNWTRDELVEWLVPNDADEEGGLEVFREAGYPSFTFGGVKGQSVVTVIFRRRGASTSQI